MISRRGFFGMLAGLAASPVLAPLVKILPQSYTTYLLPNEAFYYSKEMMSCLAAATPFQKMMKEKPMPFNGGKTIQFFRYKIEEAA